MRHQVEKTTTLGECLGGLFAEASGRTIKQMLEYGRVRVGGSRATRKDLVLAPGAVVEIDEGRPAAAPLPAELKLVYEDDEVIVVDKAAGLLSIATPKERERTAYAMLRASVKERDSSQKVFIVHRLDRDVSGLLVLARTEAAKLTLQAQFRVHSVERIYRAVVEGRIAEEEGRIDKRLHEDGANRVRETRPGAPGQDAVTHFKVIARTQQTTTLDVRLETGRKHQVRAHLASIGHPIVGDKTYGAKTNPLHRLALHARSLAFDHPRTGVRCTYTSEPPRSFRLRDG